MSHRPTLGALFWVIWEVGEEEEGDAGRFVFVFVAGSGERPYPMHHIGGLLHLLAIITDIVKGHHGSLRGLTRS